MIKKKIYISVIIILLLLQIFYFNVNADITIHTPDVFAHVDNITYNTTHNMSFNRVLVEDNYLQLNSSKFYVNSPSNINISMDYIRSNIYDAGYGDLAMSFYVENTSDGDDVYFNISGFLVGIVYEIDLNGVEIESYEANTSGYITFSNNDWGAIDFIEILRKMPANPALVSLVVSDNTINDICAYITIMNEGASDQEYIYYYWITSRADGDYGDVDTVDSASSSKMIEAGDSYVVGVCLSLYNTGYYYFKVEVFWDDDSSEASERFLAETTTGGGGGSGGGGGGATSKYELTISCQYKQAPLENVYVKVFENNDLVDYGYTDVDGSVEFNIAKHSTIKLTCSRVGYITKTDTLTVDSDMVYVVEMEKENITVILLLIIIILIILTLMFYYYIRKKKTAKVPKKR